MDRQLRVTDDVCEQHMRDLELNFLCNLGSHMGSHGNARRKNTLTYEPREETFSDSLLTVALDLNHRRCPPQYWLNRTYRSKQVPADLLANGVETVRAE